MKRMDIDQLEKAIIEITLGKKSPKLKKQFPEEYRQLEIEIRGITKKGGIVDFNN